MDFSLTKKKAAIGGTPFMETPINNVLYPEKSSGGDGICEDLLSKPQQKQRVRFLSFNSGKLPSGNLTVRIDSWYTHLKKKNGGFP